MTAMDVLNNVDHPALDDQDESVRIAVRALGDMKNSGFASASTCESPVLVKTLADRFTQQYSLPQPFQ